MKKIKVFKNFNIFKCIIFLEQRHFLKFFYFCLVLNQCSQLNDTYSDETSNYCLLFCHLGKY